MSESLKTLRDSIQCQVDSVDVKSHSHNIISLTLQKIAREFGDDEANKAVTDFGLERLGWCHKVCDHCGHWPCGCGG